MKNKIWLLQLPVAAAFAFLFWVYVQGERGELRHPILRETVYSNLRRFEGVFTDLKFRTRGPQAPKNNVVIVAIDDYSLETIGRWPWSRDTQSQLLQAIFMAGAKVVGLDYVNSEPQKRMNEQLEQILSEKGFGPLISQYDSDRILKDTIQFFNDKLVLGHASLQSCAPALFARGSETAKNDCPVDEEDVKAGIPKSVSKFAYSSVQKPPGFDIWKTPQRTIFQIMTNLAQHNEVAVHAGLFDVEPDRDGIVRRTHLAWHTATGDVLPTLALEMARVGLGEDLEVTFNDAQLVSTIRFKKSGRMIPTTPNGNMDINFRGGNYAFQTITATDILTQKPEFNSILNRKIAAVPAAEALKDAYVLVGITAQAVYDMRNFPFESGMAGVEGHANILDNLLSGDPMTPVTAGTNFYYVFALLGLGILIAFAKERMSSIPGLLMFASILGGLWAVDFRFLFPKGLNLPTSLVYAEFVSMFVLTMAVKYVLEEKDKKFLKSAFGKYVAPAVVESLVKNPDKLSLGGEKKELTIMFSDVRNFTTLSEKMDAPTLAHFLNDYLGRMTALVFSHKGTLDKYIGDAIMAFWNAPLSVADHSLQSLLSAIEMQKVIKSEHPRYMKEFGVDIQAGIGIHTGTVSVGNMGSKDNFNYTVIGDDVNLASRLEGLTKHYGVKILTTRQTLDGIKAANLTPPAHRSVDLVKVKGKTKPVEIIQILDETLPKESLDLFAEARSLFTRRDWDKAREAFLNAERLMKLPGHQKDGPCQLYVERCDEYKNAPPPADWDGAMAMTSK